MLMESLSIANFDMAHLSLCLVFASPDNRAVMHRAKGKNCYGPGPTEVHHLHSCCGVEVM